MGRDDCQPSGERTCVFGLTRDRVRPIVDAIAGGCGVEAFDIRIEHEASGCGGYQAEKLIPTVAYSTRDDRRGETTVFVKWFHRSGPAEAHHYAELARLQAPIPRLYGSLVTPDGREMLFLEWLATDPDLGTLLSDPDHFRAFLSVMARLNAVRPTGRYAARLRRMDVGRDLRIAAETLAHLWQLAEAAQLGDALSRFCADSHTALPLLQSFAEELARPVGQMPTGFVHTDLYPENTGWRRDTGDLVVFDLEFVAIGPRFYDVARWLGAPDAAEGLACLRKELARHYLDEYAWSGGPIVSTDHFLHETSILWLAQKLDLLNWRLGRALDGRVDWTDDRDEGRRVFREYLRRDLVALLLHAT